MTFRAFSGWLVRSILGLVLFTLLFSLFLKVDTKQLASGLFNDLYDRASPESQARLNQGIDELCEESAEEACKLQDPKARYLAILELALSKRELPTFTASRFILPLSIAAVLLLALLVFIERDAQLLQWHFGKMFVKLGVLWLILYAVGFLYTNVFPIDTSEIVDKIASGDISSGLAGQAVFTLFPLAIAKIFGLPFLYAGVSFCVLGAMLLILAKRGVKDPIPAHS